jgi:signal transduction histidine kinase
MYPPTELLERMQAAAENSEKLLADADFPIVYQPRLQSYLRSLERLYQFLPLIGDNIESYAHEIRTCLGPIIAWPTLILCEANVDTNPPLNALQQQILERLIEDSDLLLELINGWLFLPQGDLR